MIALRARVAYESADMPPRTPAIKLSTLMPTPEELTKAKELLKKADARDLASKKASMKHYLTVNPDPDASSAKGKNKMEYIEKYMVHQMRCKDAAKTSKTTTTQSVDNKAFQDEVPMSEEVMDREMGAQKAATLRASGTIKSQPCSHTGSTEKHMIEWIVPKKWKRKEDSEKGSITMESVTEADEKDFDAFGDFKQSTSASSGVDIKKEPESDTMKLATRVETLKANTASTLRKFQDHLLAAKMTLTKAEGAKQKYAEPMMADMKIHIGKLTKLCKTI